MKVKALITGYDLTEGKVYEVKFEYDTVYELQCDTGKYCRPKTMFEPFPKSQEDLGEELCAYCDLDENNKGVKCYGGEPIFCHESGHCEKAYQNYLEEAE